MNRILIYISVFLMLISMLYAQKATDRSRQLQLGQEFPSVPDLPILNFDTNVIEWGELGDKVIILDFFDTYCVNCIAAMPKLQLLQDDLSDKVQIVLVTWQDRETIENFYKTNAFLQKNNVRLPTIYADTIMRRYFPHRGVPHTAWISHNKVQAVTFSDFVRKENIEHLYNTGNINLPLKNDFEDSRTDYNVGRGGAEAIAQLSITGYQNGKSWRGIQMEQDSLAEQTTIRFYNRDILGAYTAAYSKFKKPEFILKEERIVWDVGNPDRYRYLSGDGKNAWLLDHAICYERICKEVKSEEDAARLIIDDLNRELGLDVYWSTRELPCLVLQKLDQQIRVSKTDGTLEGTGVLAFMIDHMGKFPPVLDDVKSSIMMNINNYSSLESLNRQLSEYGLLLKEEVRSLEVLVVKEID